MDSLKLWLQQILGRHSYAVVELYYFCRYQLFYRGDKRTCPCCSARLKNFLPLRTHTGTLVPSVICPRCDAHPRHRLLWHYLRAKHGELFMTELQFLHLAPEFCFTRHFRKLKNLHYVTADIEMPQVDCRVDICHLPFAENSFDVLFCNHVLEHVPADREAMSELFRVLRPAGWALLQVPIDKQLSQTLEDESIVSPEERERLFGQNDHVRQYGADFQGRLSAAGFAVEVIEYPGTLNPSLIEECGLDPDESIYLCRKRSDAVKLQRG
jgi:SAM-dependent methyltransferase